MSITARTLARTLRSWPVVARNLCVVTLAAILAMGTLVATAPKAYAAVTELRTALKTGADIPATLAAFSAGSNPNALVVGAHRSTDGGVSWTSDETLTTMQESGTWLSASNGSLYGISGANRAVAYDVVAGTAATYALPVDSWSQMNGTWVMSTTATGGSAYNYVTGAAPSVSPPAGTTVLGSLSAQLGPGSAVVWHATSASDGTSVFAVAPSPSQAAAPWVAIAGVKDWTLDGSQLIYAFDAAPGLKLCVRPLANLSAAPVCAVPSTTVPTPYGVDIYVVGGRTFLSAHYDTGVTKWYVTNALTMAEVQLPSGSSIDKPLIGDVPYVLLRDADSVPSFKKVNLDASLSAGFTNPATALSAIEGLAVAPDRIVGADNSDASNQTFPAWSRTVSGALGAETALPKRASGLAASAGRTAVSGRDGLSMLDRGTVKYTFADAHLGQLSGPYVSQPLFDASFAPYTAVSKVDGTFVKSFSSWSGVLFGSRYLTFLPDANPAGTTAVVITDLTSGVTSSIANPLAAASAACVGWVAWNDLVAATCDSGHAVRVYSIASGQLVASTASTEALLSVKELGDGYAVVYGTFGYQLLTLATSQLSQLVDCQSWTVSDGVGHVACSSSSELIWRDYSSLSTSAGRVLGWNAPSLFATNVATWTPEIDVSKAFNAGTLTISQGATTVRTLTVPASADGSVRGVSWDGKNTGGTFVTGTFTVTLSVSGADGSGQVLAVDGSTPPTFTVTRTIPGSFVALTPSRLLDTRDGTGAALGAVGAAGVVDLQVTGRGGVPVSGVGAVILNVTAVTPAGSGYLTVFPTGGAVPNASNVNFVAGQVVPNLVVAKLGAGGKVSIRNTSPGSTHMVADVAGYFVDGTVTDPGGLTALTPSRLLDTRNTGIVPANGSVKVQASGLGGVPAAGVSAVVVNLTAVTPAGSGFLTAYPTGGAIPNASNVNFTAGQVVPNLAFVKLAADGSFTVKNSSPGATHVVADVAGYVLDGTVTGSGMFVPLPPTRVLDTRPVYGGSGAVGANSTKKLTMTGSNGVPPTGVSAVVLNVTAVASAAGFLTVYPSDAPTVPNASNVNFVAGQVVPNLVAVKTSATGEITIRNSSAGSTNVIADVAGYFTS